MMSFLISFHKTLRSKSSRLYVKSLKDKRFAIGFIQVQKREKHGEGEMRDISGRESRSLTLSREHLLNGNTKENALNNNVTCPLL